MTTTGDDRPERGEPQADMHVTDRQWTYQVIARFTAAEAKRLFALSRDARIAQNREPEGGTDDNEASG